MASDGNPAGRHRGWRIAGIAAAALLAAFLIFVLWAHRPAIAEIERPARAGFDPALVEHGRQLAMVSNCVSCHQAPGGGRPYAGGYGVKSPFGTIYGSNITPDPRAGIGRWSYAAFERAMRRGVSRDGHLLYPAFPYTHFNALTDGDLGALYAFLMTRDAVRYTPPGNRLIPPLGFRPLVAGWNLLFFRPEPFRADPAHDGGWNRGAYLGEALAHCSGCHSPRGLLGQEKAPAYGGGWSDGWYAPPINAQSPPVRAWTPARLAEYLSTGLSPGHAASAGPMGSVAHNLARAPAGDVAALSTYYAWQMRDAPAARAEPPLPDHEAAAVRAFPAGAALFQGACAACHGAGAPMMAHGRPALPLGTPFHENNPRDAIAIVLRGLEPPVSPAGPYMPAYADQLTDRQIADVIGYLHARYGTGPEWRDLPAEVKKARKATAP